MSHSKARQFALPAGSLFALALFAYALVQTAWMCDDAFITLRTVDNFVNGYGLVWNVGERVQSYTHPLWMLLLSASYAITREPYFTTLAVTMGLSLVTAGLILWRARASLWATLTVAILLVASKAFTDYSTSGLENSLAHLLLVLFVILNDRSDADARTAAGMGAVAGLLALNRLDHALLVLPTLFIRLWKLPRKQSLVALGLALGPIGLWTLFSLVYYGFPFPNTFYAKQTSSIPRMAYLEQGLIYLWDVITHDPLTPALIAFSALGQRRGPSGAGFAVGTAAYLAYIVWIGGDFMTGRLLSAPYVIAMARVAGERDVSISPLARRLAPIGALALGLFTQPAPVVLSGADYGRGIDAYRARGQSVITDERAVYYPPLGLLPTLKGATAPSRFFWSQEALLARERGAQFYVFPTVGAFGYYAGAGMYIVDNFALTDAFLSRLPGDPNNWRVGHIWRRTPDGYLLSRFTGQNLLRDPQLAQFYDDLKLVTSGPVWSGERFSAIVRLNTTPPPAWKSLPNRRADFFIGEISPNKQPRPIRADGIDVIPGYISHAPTIQLVATPGVAYTIELYQRTRQIGLVAAEAAQADVSAEFSIYQVDVGGFAEQGYDRFRITPATTKADTLLWIKQIDFLP